MIYAVVAASAADGPTLADWLQGWGSVAAVGATLFLLWHEMREARRGRKAAAAERQEAAQDRELARKDRELAAAERRETVKGQARTVVIGELLISTDPADGAFAVRRVQVPVSNFGTQPVLDLRVILDCVTGPIARLPCLIGSSSALGPGQAINVDFVLDLISPWGATGDEAEANVVITIHFTDATGLQWTRRMTEQPEQVLDLPASGVV